MRRFYLFRSNIRGLEYYHKYKDLETFKKNCHDYYMLLPVWLLENNHFDEVIIFRLQPKNKVDDIIFTIGDKKYIQKFVNNLGECFDFQKPDIAFFRGGFKEYDEIIRAKKDFFSIALYLGAGRRILPQWGGIYDIFLMEDERDFVKDKKCIPFYKTASPYIFYPIENSEIKWDICWPCNFTQIKFKGQRDFIKMISQRPKLQEYSIVHCGNEPEKGKALCKEYKIDNIEFVGHVTRPELNEILNKSKFGLNLSNLLDGCPRVSTEILMSGTPLLISEYVRLLRYFKQCGVIEVSTSSIYTRLVKAMKNYDEVKSNILKAREAEFSFDTVCKKNISLWKKI
jgi:glycosyltransferase involved in cell wall biosynthesis